MFGENVIGNILCKQRKRRYCIELQ